MKLVGPTAAEVREAEARAEARCREAEARAEAECRLAVHRQHRHSAHPAGAFGLRKIVHPNSLANLRPPWQKGESGNRAGRPKGSRTRQIGKQLLTIDDYRAFYQKRLRALEADPQTRLHATEIAALDLEAMELQQRGPQTKLQKRYLCDRCGTLLFEPILLLDGGRYHQNCVAPELWDRRTSVQPIVDAVLAAAIPEKGGNDSSLKHSR